MDDRSGSEETDDRSISGSEETDDQSESEDHNHSESQEERVTEEVKVMDGQVVPEGDSEVRGFHVPRVLRFQISDTAPPPERGYHPGLSVCLAEGYCWVSYKNLKATFRDLTLLAFSGRDDVMMARLKLKDLMSAPCPFSSSVRFPVDEVYVCLDRLPLSKLMLKVQQVLAKSSSFDSYNSRDYYRAVGEAMELLDKDADGPFPLLYRRSIFESAFLLTWVE